MNYQQATVAATRHQIIRIVDVAVETTTTVEAGFGSYSFFHAAADLTASALT